MRLSEETLCMIYLTSKRSVGGGNSKLSTLNTKHLTVKRSIWVLFLWFGVALSYAQTTVHIANPQEWKNTELKAFVGQTVVFDCPMYITYNAYGRYSVSPRRLYSPTNQALPKSEEYQTLITLNAYGQMSISDLPGYHRCGEMIDGLTVSVESYSSVTYKSGTFRGNTRADMERALPPLNQKGEPRLIVCAANLEYYLVEQLGGSMGPRDEAEHQKQRAKVSKALAKIGADIYGLVEVQQGQNAMAEIAADLTANTGHPYDYVDDGGSANGTYTKSGYVYRTDKVQPEYRLFENNSVVQNRKKIQCFRELDGDADDANDELFLFSLNHFKAKSGSGTGLDADQGDGQGIFNHSRTQEALSVINQYGSVSSATQEHDILIMGDLNAYAMEDPITTLTSAGMIDLHRAFHADSSYSYVFGGKAGYLDHALSNSTLFPQITGMAAYHLNSDESDEYTYDKSGDQTMFRYSDHDPILVGLALDKTLQYNPGMNITRNGNTLIINNAGPTEDKSFYRIYTLQGLLLEEAEIRNSQYEVRAPASTGVYIIQVFYDGKVTTLKVGI